MSSEGKDFGTIVELLEKDYLLKSEKNLKHEIGEITHDFINRGLYNSTACTGKQLQAYFDHIDKLVNYILKSLQQDFVDIPWEHVKEKLLTIIDEEYKKLVPVANSHLVNAGLAQQGILEGFERQINNKKEKTKQAIETRLALLEKQKAISKNKKDSEEKEEILESKPPELLQEILWILQHGRKYWKLIVLAVIILGIFFGLKFNLHNKIFNLLKNRSSSSYGRTQLYPRTKKRVDDFYESIRNEKLDPWLFINAGVEVRVTKYNGDVINYSGILFTGAPRIIFWSDDFIPPFIEDAIIKVFDQTIDECRKNSLDPEIYVYEAKGILSGFIYKIYNRMADMDQKLLKQVHPENSGRRDVKLEIEKMCKHLDEQYNAALLLASKGKNTN